MPCLLEPVATFYHSRPFRSQFALKHGASESAGLAVMNLALFYEPIRWIEVDERNSSDAFAFFASDAVDLRKQQYLQSPCVILRHLQEKEDDLVIDLCRTMAINEAVPFYRNEQPGPASFVDLRILTSAQFQTRFSHCLSEIILQKLDSCASESFSKGHLFRDFGVC